MYLRGTTEKSVTHSYTFDIILKILQNKCINKSLSMATKVLHISELLLNPYVQSNPIQVHLTANLS